MKNKLPDYIYDAQRAWRSRQRKKGWKTYQIFSSVDIINKMKNYYNKIKDKSKHGA